MFQRRLHVLATDGHTRSTFELDTTDPDKPILRLEVMIDGKPEYQYVMLLVGYDSPMKGYTAVLNSLDHPSSFRIQRRWVLLCQAGYGKYSINLA